MLIANNVLRAYLHCHTSRLSCKRSSLGPHHRGTQNIFDKMHRCPERRTQTTAHQNYASPVQPTSEKGRTPSMEILLKAPSVSDSKPIVASHSTTKAFGNFDSMLVLVGTTSPILRSKTSDISSQASPVRPRLESFIAKAITFSIDGFGSGNAQRF